MPLGPIEVLMISFPGNQFNGQIIPEITRLIEQNTINVVDALLILKDADGEVTFLEFDQLDADDDVARLASLFGEENAFISDDDVREFAAGLEPNCSAGLLVIEQAWSKPLRDAIADSGGELALSFRVPGAVIDEIVASA